MYYMRWFKGISKVFYPLKNIVIIKRAPNGALFIN